MGKHDFPVVSDDDPPTFCIGERKLLAAILVRAANDVLKGGACMTMYGKQEAIRWLELDREEPLPVGEVEVSKEGITFDFVCDALGLCKKTVHSRIKALTREKIIPMAENKYLIDNLENLLGSDA